MGEDVLASLASSGTLNAFKTRAFWTSIKSAGYGNIIHWKPQAIDLAWAGIQMPTWLSHKKYKNLGVVVVFFCCCEVWIWLILVNSWLDKNLKKGLMLG